ncbi:hypothetical protein GCM10025759_23000 [Lysobacter panacisoli]|uniref:DUF2007 domain-containing protein n=1 Tax=Lysobacter panacisoli TaxID=1255263 RepID=A0ABP9LIS5_9GAMM
MRVLTYVYDESELTRITSLLHEKGIPTFCRSVRPARGAVPRWIVFVCLNSQASDAAQVLKDPNHVPSYSVNVDTFERAAYSRNMDLLVKWGTILLVSVAALFALVVSIAYKQAL